MSVGVNALPMLSLSLHDAPREEEPFIGEEHAEEPVRYVLKINEAERAASTRAQASFLRIRRALRRKVRAKVAFGNKADQQGLRLSEKKDETESEKSIPQFPIVHATVAARDVENIDTPVGLARTHARIREVTIHAFETRKHIQGLIDSAKANGDEDEYKRQVAALNALPSGTKMIRAGPGMPAAIKRAAQARGIAFEHGLSSGYSLRTATTDEKKSYADPSSQTHTIQLNHLANPEISNSYVAVYISPKIDGEYTETEFETWEPLFGALHQTLTKMLPIAQHKGNIQGLVDQTIRVARQFRAWKRGNKMANHRFRYAMPYSNAAKDPFVSTRMTFRYMAQTDTESWSLAEDGCEADDRKTKIEITGLSEQGQAKKYYKHIAYHTKDNVWAFLKVNADVWKACRELQVGDLPLPCRPLFMLLRNMKLSDVCRRINGNRNGIYISLGKFNVDAYTRTGAERKDHVSLKFDDASIQVPHIIATENKYGEIEYNVSQLFSIIVLTGMRRFRMISSDIQTRQQARRATLSANKDVLYLLNDAREDIRSAVYAIKNYAVYLSRREKSAETALIRTNRALLQANNDLSQEQKEALQAEMDKAKNERNRVDREFKESGVYQEIRKYAGFYKRRSDFYEQFAGVFAHTFEDAPFGRIYTGTGQSKDAAGLFNAVGEKSIGMGSREQWKRVFTVWARSAKGNLNYALLPNNAESMGVLAKWGVEQVFPALAHFETPTMSRFLGEVGGDWLSDAFCDWSAEYVEAAKFYLQRVDDDRKTGVCKWVVWAALNILRPVDHDAQLKIARQIGEIFYSNYADHGENLGEMVRKTTLEKYYELMQARFQAAVQLVQDKAAPVVQGQGVPLTTAVATNSHRTPMLMAYTDYGPGFVLHFYSLGSDRDKNHKWQYKSIKKLLGTSINRVSMGKGKKPAAQVVELKYPGPNRAVSPETPAYKALHALKATFAHLYDQAMDVCEKGTGLIRTHAVVSAKGIGEVSGTEFRAKKLEDVAMDDAEGSDEAVGHIQDDDNDGVSGAGSSTNHPDDGDYDYDDDGDYDYEGDDYEGANAGSSAELTIMSDDVVANALVAQPSSTDDVSADELMKATAASASTDDALVSYGRAELIEEADVALADPELEFDDQVLNGLHATYQEAIRREMVDAEMTDV